MENRQEQIFEEIKSMVASLKTQVEELERKLEGLQMGNVLETEVVQTEECTELVEDVMEMEVSLDMIDIDIAPDPEELPEPEDTSGPEDAPAPVLLIEAKNLSDDLPADDDLPFFDEPEAAEPTEPTEPPVKETAPVAVIDAMTARQAWRTDMPGTPVRDIRSAISLNDRILFINYLFNEDPMAFQATLTELNSMPSFDEAVNNVVAQHPEWDLESDTVYRFMMALRRRLQ